MCPPGSATAFASLRRTTLASSGIGSAAAALELADQLGRAPRGRPPRRRRRRIRTGGSAFPVSSIVRTCASTASPSQRSTRSGTSGAIRSASAGTPKTAASTSDDDRGDAPADDLQPAAPLASRRCGRPARTPRRSRSRAPASRTSSRARIARADLAEPQQAGGRREMIELVVGPAREHVAVLVVAHDEDVGRKLDQHGALRAGHAVEEDRRCRPRSIVKSRRHCSASARPSPTARARVAGAALTRSSTSTLGQLDRLEAVPPEPQLHGRLIDRRIGERHDHIDADHDRGAAAAHATAPLPSHDAERRRRSRTRCRPTIADDDCRRAATIHTKRR